MKAKLIIWLGAFIFLGDGANAQEILKDLLTRSPGPLTRAHQSIDNVQNCGSCHQNRLGGEVASEKCLTCHTDIKIRLENEKGYHWNKPQCKNCHSDHKGLNYSIFAPSNWLKNFEHDETGFELQGKHSSVPCADCHTTTRPAVKGMTPSPSYLGASTTCQGCHEKDYKHQFSKSEWATCTDCHAESATSWKKMQKKIRFDHTQTNYPLQGLHQNVKCTDCHKPILGERRLTKFAPLASGQCTDCHADPHKGNLGDNCSNCHNVYRKWKDVIPSEDLIPSPKKGAKKGIDSVPKGFDHSKTRYPLTGYHQAVSCAGCHTSAISAPSPQQLGSDSVPKQKMGFKVPEEVFMQCSGCHGLAHGEQFANQKCESCHTTERHFMQSTFTLERHSKTKFPLTGKHLVLDCNRCHSSGKFENLPSATCADCHRNPHSARQIDKTCSFCHVTTSFSWLQFDHNKNTNFNLTGKHRAVACVSCHTNQVFKDMPASNTNPNCQACHENPHGSAMPTDCASCHRTEGFKLVENFDHQKIANWALEGKHREISCQKCHADHLLKNYKVSRLSTNNLTKKLFSSTSAVKPTDCANCHVDAHKGTYGLNCASCHNNTSFSVEYGARVHDLGYFKLQGAHNQLACTDCHRPNTNLQGTGITCQWCHEKNDIHLGKMGNTCGDCHGQTAWVPTKFKHNQTAFRLTGAHRYVECRACHVNQIYQGLPNDCAFCHSASKISNAYHNSAAIEDCGDCHSSISWKVRRNLP